MFTSLDRVDWALLHQQKRALLTVLDGLERNSPAADALWGLVHLLDALQDDAVEAGRWAFTDEPGSLGSPEQPVCKRYYVEDDDGRHHGPFDDYEEAASTADAIHGRIIAQEVEQQSVSLETGDEGGGA